MQSEPYYSQRKKSPSLPHARQKEGERGRILHDFLTLSWQRWVETVGQACGLNLSRAVQVDAKGVQTPRFVGESPCTLVRTLGHLRCPKVSVHPMTTSCTLMHALLFMYPKNMHAGVSDTHAHARTQAHVGACTHAHAQARMHARTHAREHGRAQALRHGRTHDCTHGALEQQWKGL